MSGIIVLALRLLAALALLLFLGWAFSSAWKGINEQERALANRRIPGLMLTQHSGEGYSTPRHFAQPEVFIGRDPACDVVMADETVSTRHAQLAYHHGQWWLQDLQSMNGTFLNEVRLTMPTVITAGDEIRCGNASLLVNMPSDVFISPTQKITGAAK